MLVSDYCQGMHAHLYFSQQKIAGIGIMICVLIGPVCYFNVVLRTNRDKMQSVLFVRCSVQIFL